MTVIITVLPGNASFASVNNEKTGAQSEDIPMLKGSASIIDIKSDRVDYFQDKNQFVATGHVIITLENDGTIIKSDRVIYDRNIEEIISEKNVEIIKNGNIVYGDYAKFDLKTNSGLIKSPDTCMREIKINATTAKVYPGHTDLLKGKATIDKKDLMIMLSTGAVGSGRNKNIFQEKPGAKSRFHYNIKAKEVVVKPLKDRNIITLKNATITINKYPVAKIPSLLLNSSKESNRVETTLPEFGTLPALGGYFGYGYVFNLPKGSTLKALPLFTFGQGKGSNAGFGGMARFMSATNKTEVFYSTLKNKLLFRGEQEFLSPKTKIQYGGKSYIENGFFGRQRAGYLAEIVDKRDFISAYNLNFSLRSSAGFLKNNKGNYSTGRFQLQGNLGNIAPFWHYKEYLNGGVGSNFAVVAYGSGDTYGVARIGPTLFGDIGPLSYWTAYYQGAICGATPFLFDKYIYGKSNVMFRTTTKVSNYLTVGYEASLNLTRDNWQKKKVVENELFFWAGPEDLKLKVGYDVERARTLFGFDMLIGSKTSALDFDKLRILPQK